MGAQRLDIEPQPAADYRYIDGIAAKDGVLKTTNLKLALPLADLFGLDLRAGLLTTQGHLPH